MRSRSPSEDSEVRDEDCDKDPLDNRGSSRCCCGGAGLRRRIVGPYPCRSACIRGCRVWFSYWVSGFLLPALSVLLSAAAILPSCRVLSASGPLSAAGRAGVWRVYAFGGRGGPANHLHLAPLVVRCL